VRRVAEPPAARARAVPPARARRVAGTAAWASTRVAVGRVQQRQRARHQRQPEREPRRRQPAGQVDREEEAQEVRADEEREHDADRQHQGADHEVKSSPKNGAARVSRVAPSAED